MPNTFAYLVLFLWPIVALIALWRRPLPEAIAWAIIAGYLLLPSLRPGAALDPPLLPAYDKDLAASLAAILLIMARGGRLGPNDAGNSDGLAPVLRGWLPRQRWVRAALLGIIGGSFLTALANTDPLVYGPTVLPGVRTYDAFSVVLNSCVPLIPFILGWKYLGNPQGQRVLLTVFAVAAAFYILPTLFEVRMSPQLSHWIYGFFPHSFAQHIRAGGFRPVVFLHHALWLGQFLAVGFLVAIGLSKLTNRRGRLRYALTAAALLITLLLAKNLGALLLALIFAPVILFRQARGQLLVAAIVASLVMTFPALRASGLIPVEQFANAIESLSPDRADSFRFRIANENAMLDKAAVRPLLGWGSWNRWRVYDDEGRDTTVSDGMWIITLAEGGWLRYLSVFGLLGLPMLLAGRRSRRLALDRSTATIAIVLAVNMLDLIPNASLTPLTWLFAGSLTGRLEVGSAAVTV